MLRIYTLPENNLHQVDSRVAVHSVHEQGVLDIPTSLPEVPGVALPAVLGTKLDVHLVRGPNMFENGVLQRIWSISQRGLVNLTYR